MFKDIKLRTVSDHLERYDMLCRMAGTLSEYESNIQRVSTLAAVARIKSGPLKGQTYERLFDLVFITLLLQYATPGLLSGHVNMSVKELVFQNRVR